MAVTIRYDVGKEVEAYCGKCKQQMLHVITALAGDHIKKVMCKGCNSTHGYRPEKPDPVVRPRKKTESVETLTKVRRPRKRDWETMRSRIIEGNIVDYSMAKDLTYAEAINHKKFGIGVITKVLSDKKIEVVFETATKVLAHNWK